MLFSLERLGLDVIIKANLNVSVLRLVREAMGGAIVLVLAIGADNDLVVGDLGVVNDGSTCRLNELEDAG